MAKSIDAGKGTSVSRAKRLSRSRQSPKPAPPDVRAVAAALRARAGTLDEATRDALRSAFNPD